MGKRLIKTRLIETKLTEKQSFRAALHGGMRDCTPRSISGWGRCTST